MAIPELCGELASLQATLAIQHKLSQQVQAMALDGGDNSVPNGSHAEAKVWTEEKLVVDCIPSCIPCVQLLHAHLAQAC